LLQTGDVAYSEATTYDPLGRPLSCTGRDGQTVTIAYSTRADASTGTLQAVATVTYSATASQPATTQVIVQDATGRTLSVTDQNQGVTTYEYTAAQGAGASAYAVVTVTNPGGDVTAYSFDAQKRKVKTVQGQNGLTRVQTFAYDCLGRLTSQTTAQGTSSYTTSYAYGLDNDTGTWTVSVGRPGMTTGPTVQYYNGLAQLVKQADPSGTITTSTYTPWGALASYANGRGQVLSYDFDDAGRLKQTRFPDGTAIAYTLDGNGNRLTAAQGGQVVRYQFDNWNRMKSRTGVEGALVQYAYWPTDQVQSLTYPDGKVVQYGIDALGRMTSVSDWSQPPKTVAYGYTVLNQLASIAYPNGAASAYGYDGSGRLDSLAHTSDGLVIARWQAQYDALGQLSTVSVIEPLAPAAPAAGTSLTYTDGNQLATVDGAPAAFDADGNYLGTSSVTPGNGYDIFNRLTSMAGTNGTAAFGYDPDGLRVNAAAGSAQANYVFDINAYQSPMVQRGDPVRALAGTVTRATAGIPAPDPFYVQGPVLAMTDAVDRLLELRDGNQAVQTRFLHGQGLIGQWDAAGTGRYFHFDPAGNLWAMTDAATGAVTDAAVFGPFAQAFARSGSTDTPFRFSGQFGVMDDGTGALFARARSYDTTQMRFLQIDYLLGDPMSPQSLNPYAYALGNPAQASDPLGLDAWKWATGIGTAIGVALIGGWIYSGGASSFFGGAASTASRMFGRGGSHGGHHGGGDEGGSDSGSDAGSDAGSDDPLLPEGGNSEPQSFEIEGQDGGYESDTSSEADETTGLFRRGSGGQRTFIPKGMLGGWR
jgi:RHS repeat-associated protein